MCVAELRGLGEVNEELRSRGGRLLAVAVDPPDVAHRVVEQNGLAFSILCDTQREVVRAYGLLHEGGGPDGSDIAVPAHILIGGDGRILSSYVSRRIQDRLDPADVLAIVKRLAQ
ncbi:MAG: redoxin domain-containing protein [Phycisphaerae bacterium]